MSGTHIAVVCDVQTLWPHRHEDESIPIGVNLFTGIVRGDDYEEVASRVSIDQLIDLLLPWRWKGYGGNEEPSFHVGLLGPSPPMATQILTPTPVPPERRLADPNPVVAAVEEHLERRTRGWTRNVFWDPDGDRSQGDAEGFQLHAFLAMVGTWPAPLPQQALRLSAVLEAADNASSYRRLTAAPEFSALGINARPVGEPSEGPDQRYWMWDYETAGGDPVPIRAYLSWSRIGAAPLLRHSLVDTGSYWVQTAHQLEGGGEESVGIESEDLTDQLAIRAASILDTPSRLLEGLRAVLSGRGAARPPARRRLDEFRNAVLREIVASLRDLSGCGAKAVDLAGETLDERIQLGPDDTCLMLEILSQCRDSTEPVASPTAIAARYRAIVDRLLEHDSTRGFEDWLKTLREMLPDYSDLLDAVDPNAQAYSSRLRAHGRVSDRGDKRWMERVEGLVGRMQEDDVLRGVLLSEWESALDGAGVKVEHLRQQGADGDAIAAAQAVADEIRQFRIQYWERIRSQILPTMRIRQRLLLDHVGIGLIRLTELDGPDRGVGDRDRIRAHCVDEVSALVRVRVGLESARPGYEALRPTASWSGDSDGSMRDILLSAVRESAARFALRRLLPPDPEPTQDDGSIQEFDEGSPTATAHPLVLQMERLTRFDDPDGPDADAARLFHGSAVLLRWSDAPGGPTGPWRCLHTTNLEISQLDGMSAKVLHLEATGSQAEVVSPSRLGFVDSLRRSMVSYDGSQHPTAVSREQTRRQDAIDKERSRTVASTIETPILRPRAPVAASGYRRSIWAQMPPLAFGLWYEALPFAIANSGALPAEIAHTSHPSFLRDAVPVISISQTNPAVVEYGGEQPPASEGEWIGIFGVRGMVEVNGREFRVANLDATSRHFQLAGEDATGYGAYDDGGLVLTSLRSAKDHIRRIRYLRRVGVGALRVRPTDEDPTLSAAAKVPTIASELDPAASLETIGPAPAPRTRGYFAERVSMVGAIANVSHAAGAALVEVTYAEQLAPISNGDQVRFSGIRGMVELNGRIARVARHNSATRTFALAGIDATGFGAYEGGGQFSYDHWIGSLDLSSGSFRVELEAAEPGVRYPGEAKFELSVRPDEESEADMPIGLAINHERGEARFTVGVESQYISLNAERAWDVAIESVRQPVDGDGGRTVGRYVAALVREQSGDWVQILRYPEEGAFDLPSETPYRIEVSRRDSGENREGWFLYRHPRVRTSMPAREFPATPTPFGGTAVPGGPVGEVGLTLLAPPRGADGDGPKHPDRHVRRLARPALETTTYLRWLEADIHAAATRERKAELEGQWTTIYDADEELRSKRSADPKLPLHFEEVVEDPAVSAFVVEVVGLRSERLPRSNWGVVPLEAKPPGARTSLSNRFATSHAREVEFEIRTIHRDASEEVLHTGENSIEVRLRPAEIAEVRIYPAVEESWIQAEAAGADGRRFHPKIAEEIPRRTVRGVEYALFTPMRILAEGMEATLPDAEELWKQLNPTFNGQMVELFWNRGEAFNPRMHKADDNVGQVAFGHQVSSDTGRPVSIFPFDQASIDDPAASSLDDPPVPEVDGPETSAMLWEAQVFGERDERSFRGGRRRIAARSPRTVLDTIDLTKDRRARYFRFLALVRHRYADLLELGPEGDREARREVVPPDPPADESSEIALRPYSDRWRRLLVPSRWRQEVPLPRVRVVLPLTRPPQDRMRPALLVALDGPWGEVGGLAEWLEVGIEPVVVHPKPGDDRPDPSQRLEAGPDATVRRDGASPKIIPLEVTGPVGHTFDTDTNAPLLVNSSFLVAVGDDDEDRAFDMLKLRFRRVLLPEGTFDPTQHPTLPLDIELSGDRVVTLVGAKAAGVLDITDPHSRKSLVRVSVTERIRGFAFAFQTGDFKPILSQRTRGFDLRLIVTKNVTEDLSGGGQVAGDEQILVEAVRPLWTLSATARVGESPWITLGAFEWEQPVGADTLAVTWESDELPPRVDLSVARASSFTRAHWAQILPLGPLPQAVDEGAPPYAAMRWDEYELVRRTNLEIKPRAGAGRLTLVSRAGAALPREDHQGMAHLVLITRKVVDASGRRGPEVFVGLYEPEGNGEADRSVALVPIGIPHSSDLDVNGLRARVLLVQQTPVAGPSSAPVTEESGAAVGEILFGEEMVSEATLGSDARLRVLGVFDPIEAES